MDNKNKMNGQKQPSFIESARRTQIIECAIEVIASMGYAQASLAQIAKRAGISKGVITYHFSSKDEIMEQVVFNVYSKGASFMKSYVEAESTAVGALKAHIKSNLAFMRDNPKQIVAMIEIASSARSDDGKLTFDLFPSGVNPLDQLLRRGQREGEFREFSTHIMAMTIRGAIDKVSYEAYEDPSLDFDAYEQELATLFDLATRKL